MKHWRDGATDSLVPYDGSGFAMAYGGGVDVNVRDRAAIRVVQFDWIPITESRSWITNTIRFGFGIVYRSAE